MRNLPRLVAYFYRTKSGNEPVREWLKELSKDERRSIGEDIAMFSTSGRLESRVSITCVAIFGK